MVKVKGDGTLSFRICSFLVVEYSKALQVHQFQTFRRYKKRLDSIECTSYPHEVVCASHVGHSWHNTVGQFFLTQAIPGERVEWLAKSMKFQHRVHPT